MRPFVALVGTIAVAAAIGTAVSLTQRHPARPPGSEQLRPLPTLNPNQPIVAFGFTVADDAASNQVVLFGGVDNYASTWVWTGAAWVREHPRVSPPGRYGASAAFDPQTGELLMFGGTSQQTEPVNDTWAWDGRTWQRLDSGGATGPTGGPQSEMVWNTRLNEMMLVTEPPGLAGAGGQTWIWSGTHWVVQPHGELGTSYFGMVVAYDPISQSMIAEGCCATQRAQNPVGVQTSTWRWSGATWQAVRTTVNPADGSSLAVDPSLGLGRLVLCGCDLRGGLDPAMWLWSGSDWVAAPYPPVPIAPQAAVTDSRTSSLLFLGSAISGADSLSQTVDVWTLRNGSWVQLGI
jgi:hypothetical protein